MKTQLQERLKNILRLDGWCSYDKAHHMARLIIEHRPDKIVEIGVFGGRSLIAMGMACQHIYHGEVIGIDPWTKAAALEGGTTPENDAWWAKLDIEKIFRTCQSNVKTLGVEDWVTLVRAKDEDVLGTFLDGSVGLIHIDSNHSEAVSVRTVKDWVPKLAPGGHCIFDDIQWPTQAVALKMLREDLGLVNLGDFDMHDEKGDNAGQYAVFQKPA